MFLVDSIGSLLKIMAVLLAVTLVYVFLFIPLNTVLPPFFVPMIPTFLNDTSVIMYLSGHTRLIAIFLFLSCGILILLTIWSKL